ncbi:spore gernimation protein GerA [Heyndrickxia ginsengihumi]|uniref:Spore gernimation protein GerA n=1 Tax=Heyndrickxia ginsengihumi TaxID=363870 RepID=A0A0A6VDK6_9BACI|nr:spore germination protein [Heyndrickxia ginsengihumi]KHD85578.1 spore gernimation protein GerA [Heyndrickxia ginsengihumi]
MLRDNKFTKEALQQLFNHSSDIEVKDHKVKSLIFVYCKPIVDTSLIQSLLIPVPGEDTGSSIFNSLQVETYSKKTLRNEQIEKLIFAGKLMVVSSEESIYFYDISKIPSRQPDESVAEVSIRGPKDGFVENSLINIGLIRKRLLTSSFIVQDYTIGIRTNTKVSLLYIKDIINSDVLQDIQNRLSSLKDIDVLTSSTMLGEYLYENKFTITPLINYTGRPDFVVKSMNQGKFAIVVDGAPTVLIAPIDLTFLLKTAEDDNTSFYAASLERMLRFLGLATTIFLPGFYTALTTYHVGQLPLPLLATITVSRLGLPFSTFMEMFIMLLMIELFKEGGARLPKGIGQTVSVIGALIIGDAAIQGGITSSTVLVIIGITAISNYIVVNQSIAGNLFYVRLFVLILSYAFGIYGFVFSIFFIMLYLSNLKSFGIPYLANISSSNPKDIIYSFIRLPYSFMKKRNSSLHVKDRKRAGE